MEPCISLPILMVSEYTVLSQTKDKLSIWAPAEVAIFFISKLDGCSIHRFCHYMQLVFSQNWKIISSRYWHHLSGLRFRFNYILGWKFCWYIFEPPCTEVCLLPFQIYQKIESRYFRLAGQYETPGNCRFPLANPHKGKSLDFLNRILLVFWFYCVFVWVIHNQSTRFSQ